MRFLAKAVSLLVGASIIGGVINYSDHVNASPLETAVKEEATTRNDVKEAILNTNKIVDDIPANNSPETLSSEAESVARQARTLRDLREQWNNDIQRVQTTGVTELTAWADVIKDINDPELHNSQARLYMTRRGEFMSALDESRTALAALDQALLRAADVERVVTSLSYAANTSRYASNLRGITESMKQDTQSYLAASQRLLELLKTS